MPEVQLLEPALGLFDAGQFQGLYESTYATLSKSVSINLVTFYDDVGDCFEWVSKLPVKAVSLDFCGVVRVQLFKTLAKRITESAGTDLVDTFVVVCERLWLHVGFQMLVSSGALCPHFTSPPTTQLESTQQRSCLVQIGAATPCRTLDFLKKSGFPADKALGAGVIDGRNIWADTGNAAALVAEIKECTQAPIRVQVPL